MERGLALAPDDAPEVTEDSMATKKKMTLYLPEELLNEMRQEALRQDRSLSWIMEAAWKVARERLREMPGVDELYEDYEAAS